MGVDQRHNAAVKPASLRDGSSRRRQRNRASARSTGPSQRITRDHDRAAASRDRASAASQSIVWRLPFVEGELRLPAMRRESRMRVVLACADVLAAALALGVIGSLYPAGSVLKAPSFLMLPVVPLMGRALGLYHKDETRLRHSSLDEAPALLQLATLFSLGVWITRHVLIGGELAGSHVMTLLIGYFVIAFCARTAARVLARRILPPEQCLVIGDADSVSQLARAMAVAARGTRVVGSILCDGMASEQARFDELSDTAALEALLCTVDFERLIVAPRYAAGEQVLSLVHAAKSIGIRITVVPLLGELIGASAELENVGGLSVLGLPQYHLSRSARVSKRAFDLIGAVVGLIVLSPLIAVVAVLIKLDSPGPVMFRQTRTGRDGKTFRILKFRSMVDRADELKPELTSENQAVGIFKIADDPRITRVGRVLRKTSLDELPQLFNVLRGDMSLVGPRPLVQDEDVKVVGWFRNRLHLQPGMTGHWQVLGSSRIPLDDMIRIDCLYVANWSLWEDIKVLLQTIPYVFAGRGL
jgi:exopolysaccharide biosynthesis polyprenyl glycosylphosphotransferase